MPKCTRNQLQKQIKATRKLNPVFFAHVDDYTCRAKGIALSDFLITDIIALHAK